MAGHRWAPQLSRFGTSGLRHERMFTDGANYCAAVAGFEGGSSSSWFMSWGDERPEIAPVYPRWTAERCLLAVVASSGAVAGAPRELVVIHDGSRTAVRSRDGRLLSLTTGSTVAYAVDSSIRVHTPGESGGVVLPEDLGEEARAMINVEALFELVNGVGEPPSMGHTCEPITVRSPDGYRLQVSVDPSSGLVREATGTGPGGELTLRLVYSRVVPANSRWFDAAHIDAAF